MAFKIVYGAGQTLSRSSETKFGSGYGFLAMHRDERVKDFAYDILEPRLLGNSYRIDYGDHWGDGGDAVVASFQRVGEWFVLSRLRPISESRGRRYFLAEFILLEENGHEAKGLAMGLDGMPHISPADVLASENSDIWFEGEVWNLSGTWMDDEIPLRELFAQEKEMEAIASAGSISRTRAAFNHRECIWKCSQPQANPRSVLQSMAETQREFFHHYGKFLPSDRFAEDKSGFLDLAWRNFSLTNFYLHPDTGIDLHLGSGDETLPYQWTAIWDGVPTHDSFRECEASVEAMGDENYLPEAMTAEGWVDPNRHSEEEVVVAAEQNFSVAPQNQPLSVPSPPGNPELQHKPGAGKNLGRPPRKVPGGNKGRVFDWMPFGWKGFAVAVLILLFAFYLTTKFGGTKQTREMWATSSLQVLRQDVDSEIERKNLKGDPWDSYQNLVSDAGTLERYIREILDGKAPSLNRQERSLTQSDIDTLKLEREDFLENETEDKISPVDVVIQSRGLAEYLEKLSGKELPPGNSLDAVMGEWASFTKPGKDETSPPETSTVLTNLGTNGTGFWQDVDEFVKTKLTEEFEKRVELVLSKVEKKMERENKLGELRALATVTYPGIITDGGATIDAMLKQGIGNPLTGGAPKGKGGKGKMGQPKSSGSKSEGEKPKGEANSFPDKIESISVLWDDGRTFPAPSSKAEIWFVDGRALLERSIWTGSGLAMPVPRSEEETLGRVTRFTDTAIIIDKTNKIAEVSGENFEFQSEEGNAFLIREEKGAAHLKVYMPQEELVVPVSDSSMLFRKEKGKLDGYLTLPNDQLEITLNVFHESLNKELLRVPRNDLAIALAGPKVLGGILSKNVTIDQNEIDDFPRFVRGAENFKEWFMDGSIIDTYGKGINGIYEVEDDKYILVPLVGYFTNIEDSVTANDWGMKKEKFYVKVIADLAKEESPIVSLEGTSVKMFEQVCNLMYKDQTIFYNSPDFILKKFWTRAPETMKDIDGVLMVAKGRNGFLSSKIEAGNIKVEIDPKKKEFMAQNSEAVRQIFIEFADGFSSMKYYAQTMDSICAESGNAKMLTAARYNASRKYITGRQENPKTAQKERFENGELDGVTFRFYISQP